MKPLEPFTEWKKTSVSPRMFSAGTENWEMIIKPVIFKTQAILVVQWSQNCLYGVINWREPHRNQTALCNRVL